MNHRDDQSETQPQAIKPPNAADAHDLKNQITEDDMARKPVSDLDNGFSHGTMPASSATEMPAHDPANPYVASAPALATKSKIDSMKVVLGKWGKKAAETSKKTQTLAGNMWQHLKTAPSFADAAVGRIAQGTKVLAEGGYENIFI